MNDAILRGEAQAVHTDPIEAPAPPIPALIEAADIGLATIGTEVGSETTSAILSVAGEEPQSRRNLIRRELGGRSRGDEAFLASGTAHAIQDYSLVPEQSGARY